MITKDTKLTPKQEQFCREYVVDLNATQAAKRAGYSKKSARIIAAQNLSKLNIQYRLQQLVDELQKNTGVNAERVIREYAKVGFSNIKDFITEGNEITDISELPDEIAAAVDSIQCDIRHDGGDSDGYTEKVKVKLHSKLGALNSLGKHLKIFKDDEEKEPITIILKLPDELLNM